MRSFLSTCVLDGSQKEAFVGADEVVEIVDKSVDNKGRSNVDNVGDELKFRIYDLDHR